MLELVGPVISILVIAILAYNWYVLLRETIRNRFLQRYAFPNGLQVAMTKRYPKLSRKDFELVAHALRQLFQAYKSSRYRKVRSPSKIVADLWQEFSKDHDTYDKFCMKSFGRLLTFVPFVRVVEKDSDEENDLKRTWDQCCLQEGIYRNFPTRLPLLFAIDQKLDIPDAIEFKLERPVTPDTSNGDISSGGPSGTYYVHDFSDGGHGTGDSFGGDFGDFGSGGDGGGGGD